MKKLSNTEAELKKSVAYKKSMYTRKTVCPSKKLYFFSEFDLIATHLLIK